MVLICNKKPRLNIDGVETVRNNELVSEESGVTVTEIKVGIHTKHIKIYEGPVAPGGGDKRYWLVTGPTSKHNMVATDGLFANVVTSISDAPCPSATGVRYQSPNYGIAFDARPGSKIMETRLEKSVVLYAPLGQHEINPNEMPTPEVIAKIREAPTVQIRVGNPSNDEDCRESLDEWEKQVKGQRAQANLKNIRRFKINEGAEGEREFLAFDSQEMIEVGMGQREERMAKMYVTMQDGQSALIRWEAPTGMMLKYEHTLVTPMLNSFAMF
jgi:hypothetical protein